MHQRSCKAHGEGPELRASGEVFQLWKTFWIQCMKSETVDGLKKGQKSNSLTGMGQAGEKDTSVK